MAEYIEREAAIKSAVGALHGVSQIVAVDVVEALENEPAADVAEVRHGEWKPTYHNYYNRDGVCQIADEWHCSECKIYSRNEWNYCPNCGAKMDGKGE